MTAPEVAPAVKPSSVIELTPVEHGLALAAALCVAYGCSNIAYLLLLARSGMAPSGASMAAWVFASFRHAILATAVLLLVNSLARRTSRLGILVPAALLLVCASATGGALWDWAANQSFTELGAGALATRSMSLDQVLVWQVHNLVSPGVWLSRLAFAAGFVLAARGKGRWTEGLRFSALPSLIGLLQAPFLHAPILVLAAVALRVSVSFTLETSLVPVSERLVKRAFVTLRIDAEEPS